MKILETIHKHKMYEFRYLEESKLVQISKEGVFHYRISSASGQFVCNCPGSIYHNKCWHMTMLPQLLTQPSVNEPWAQWAEDAERIKRWT